MKMGPLAVWGITSAIVVDDALGPPTYGAIQSDEKNKWIDFVSETEHAQRVLFEAFSQVEAANLDELLIELTGNPLHISSLWELYRNKALEEAGLDLLFGAFALAWTGKAQKPLLVCDALATFVGEDKVKKFWRMEDAVNAMSDVDVAFIDFFLDDNEQVDAALQRIRNYKQHLGKAKLLFFMSSRADLETQQQVRDIIGMRSAFFEVVTKTALDSAWVIAKISEKRASYQGNKSLEYVTRTLVDAARQAANDFNDQFEKIEIHDLRLLDLSRLAAEGESVAAYLTWLASESIAAKVRRISGEKIKVANIDPGAVGFTGQVKQGRVLFELFSEVVFGPAHAATEGIHFGEVLAHRTQPRRLLKASALPRTARLRSSRISLPLVDKRRKARSERLSVLGSATPVASRMAVGPNTYLLVLTPACDLARCSPSKNVLCVVGTAEDYSDIRSQAKEKLYGKHPDGLRHLLNVEGPRSPVLITWHKDQTLMLPVRELMSSGFRRVAQMNELYAHEVKEEILRELGRVGTQIDPPPIFALHATLRWRTATNVAWSEVSVGEDSFYSAILSYSEQPRERSVDKHATVVLSDEFRRWAQAEIQQGLNGQAAPQKLRNCLDVLTQASQFALKSDFVFKKNELVVRLESETNGINLNSVLLEVVLSPEAR